MKYKMLAIGEVLWDLLPSGRQLGGAPANFAYHAHALGADARLVTRVGDDALGREVLERFRLLGLPTDTIAVDAAAPTGTVSVELGPGGQPQFTIHENVAWDRITADEIALAAAAEADAVCFGSLAQRSEPARRAVRLLVAATRPGAFRIFDVNLRPPFVDRDVIEGSLVLANVLKLNDLELSVLAEMFGLPAVRRKGWRSWPAATSCRWWPSRAAPLAACCSRAAAGLTITGCPSRCCATPSVPATPSPRPWQSGFSPAGHSTRSIATPTRSPPSSAPGPAAPRPCPTR